MKCSSPAPYTRRCPLGIAHIKTHLMQMRCRCSKLVQGALMAHMQKDLPAKYQSAACGQCPRRNYNQETSSSFRIEVPGYENSCIPITFSLTLVHRPAYSFGVRPA